MEPVMNLAFRAVASLGAALTAVALPLAYALPAQASTPGWRVVFGTHYGAATDYSGYLTAVAPSKLDLWALGGSDLSGGTPAVPVAEHWNGKVWSAGVLPEAVTSSAKSAIEAASAVSPSNIWAVTQFGGFVLHYNGAWSVAKQLAGSGQLTGITAISSTNVWVFGAGGFTGGLGTWHYNGSTWTQQTGNASGIASASAVSASNVWAIGSSGSAPQDAIVHYNGTAWQRVKATALTGRQFNRILAISATNVWVSAENPSNGTAGFLVHFNGSQWSKVTLPWTVATGDPASDGKGGIWLAVQDGSRRFWVAHRSAAGTWTRTLIGSTPTFVPSLALIPGTTAVWGAGSFAKGSAANAGVWAYGVIP
jgi:hypothetical protein